MIFCRYKEMVVKIFKISRCLKFTWDVNKLDGAQKFQIPHALKDKVHSVCQRRYVVAFLGFLCAVVMHSQRLNISIAMVAMVNSTALSTQMIFNKTTDCPAEIYNSTSSVPSRGEFIWTPELQGYILSAGFLGYVLTQIPGGILAGIFGTKVILVSGLLVSSVCNLLSPLAAGVDPYFLLASALLRGMAQGMKQPALSVLMSKWFPRSERGFLSAFIYCGYPVGAFITSIASGRLCDVDFLDGWPLVFYTFGLMGIVVALFFYFCFAERPEEDSRISDAELQHIQNLQTNTSTSRPPTPWLAILTSFPTYALIIALFGQYWMAFYFLSVHPIYLGTILHIPIRQNGALSSGPYMVQAIAGWGICYFSYWMSRNSKVKVETIRKACNSFSCIIFGLGLIGVYLAKCNIPWNEACLYIATGSVGFSFAGSLITSVDMSPTFCGPLMGFASTMASFAGFFVPVMVGNLTNDGQNLDQWGKIFLISTGVTLGCGLIFQIMGSAEVQKYDPLSPNQSDAEEKVTEGENKQAETTPVTSNL